MNDQENPYQPTAISNEIAKPPVPHSSSIRFEAWRGFKFGARITSAITSAIAAVIGVLMLVGFIYGAIITKGEILSLNSLIEVALGIGMSLLGVLLMSFYGGVAGSIIMTLAAIVRKRRTPKPASTAE